jgi:hypothetical protein
MLVSIAGDHAIVISQPAHAAVSGQLARAWGNDQFGAVEPFDDVCLGAELHDIGWIDWEQSPTLNPETGLPHSFMQLSARTHLDIWEHASRRASTFGRYPGLLTSLHFTGLYERFHDYSRDTEVEARDARALVAREHAFQQEAIARLRADKSMVDFASDELLRRNRTLVAVWDGMSLALCHGLAKPRSFGGVPATTGDLTISLEPADDIVRVDPWPFSVDRLIVHADGRILRDRYEDQESLREALASAEWTTVTATLAPVS